MRSWFSIKKIKPKSQNKTILQVSELEGRLVASANLPIQTSLVSEQQITKIHPSVSESPTGIAEKTTDTVSKESGAGLTANNIKSIPAENTTLLDTSSIQIPKPPTSANLSWNDYNKVDPPQPYGAYTSYEYTITRTTWAFLETNFKTNKDGTLNFVVKLDPKHIPKINVTLEFDKEASYVVKANVGDKKLFSHEKLHLQIAEYIITKANKNAPNLSKVTVGVYGATKANKDVLADEAMFEMLEYIKELFKDDLEKIEDKIREQYDEETVNGTDAIGQQKWTVNYKKYIGDFCKQVGWIK